MVITDKLVYIQMHKTGCSHIAKLLKETVGGIQSGNHNAATEELLNSPRLFVSSIRNPWEWYVSLWCYGCDQHGGLRQKVTTRKSALPRLLKKCWRPERWLWAYRKMTAHVNLWRDCYEDSDNPQLFRQWLKMIYDPQFKLDFGENYGDSSLSSVVGLYTYRYLSLCCRDSGDLVKGQLETYNDVHQFETENGYISEWIRNEFLEEDFLKVLKAAGEKVTPEIEKIVSTQQKSNRSSRARPTGFYYDAETAELVGKMEALIVGKFGYRFPDKMCW